MTNGLLLVDKPGGMTSHDVVGAARRQFSRKDIGHAGTLDPMATGLLVLLVGHATKLSDFILNGDKSYETTVLLGCETDTDDATGSVISQKDSGGITPEEVERAVAELTGDLELKVPIYSAIKVKGKKLYEKARRGENFEPPVRKMAFRDVRLLSFENSRVTLQFTCSKGSYVRAWGKRLGEKLGCGATLEGLRRLNSDPYSVKTATPFTELAASENIEELAGFIPFTQTLPHWPTVKAEGQDEKLLSNGQIPRKLERFLELEFGGVQSLQGVKVTSRRSGRLICLLSYQAPLSFKIRRVFPNQ